MIQFANTPPPQYYHHMQRIRFNNSTIIITTSPLAETHAGRGPGFPTATLKQHPASNVPALPMSRVAAAALLLLCCGTDRRTSSRTDTD